MASKELLLTLIVKNESKVIEKNLTQNCLIEGIRNVLIVDTGSTDNTIELCEKFFIKNNINGKVIKHSFFNCECHATTSNTKKYNCFDFAENRTYALDKSYELFKDTCDFIFMTDADDHLEEVFLDNNNNVSKISKVGLIDHVNSLKHKYNCFNIFFGLKSVTYRRPLIFPNNGKWCFKSSIHEYLSIKNNVKEIRKDYLLKKIFPVEKSNRSLNDRTFEMVSGREGDRSKDKDKYKKDGLFLESLINDMKEHQENYWRYVYYCGQSWKDYKDFERAEKWFDYHIKSFKKYKDKKINHKPWVEETYNAYKEKIKAYLFQNKSFKETSSSDEDIVSWECLKNLCEESFEVCGKHRSETLYFKAVIEKDKLHNIREALKTLEIASKIKFNENYLFNNRKIYDILIPSLYKELSNIEKTCLIINDNIPSEQILSQIKHLDIYKIKNNENIIPKTIKQEILDFKYKKIISLDNCYDLTFINYNKEEVKTIFMSSDLRTLIKSNLSDFEVTFNMNFCFGEVLEFIKDLGYNIFFNYPKKINIDLTCKETFEKIKLRDSSIKNYNYVFPRSINPSLDTFLKDKRSIYISNNKSLTKFCNSNKTFNKLLKTENTIPNKIIYIQKNENMSNKKKYDETTSIIRSLDISKIHPELFLQLTSYKESLINDLKENCNDWLFDPLLEIDKNNELINSLLENKKKNKNKIILTMTSCKRFEMFYNCIRSVLTCFPLEDLMMIDKFYCVDDGSTKEERHLMKVLFPFIEYEFVELNSNGNGKGHSNSMNLIYKKVIDEGFDYVLHLEDDYLFHEVKHYILDGLNVLENDEKVSQIVFNRCNQEVDMFRKTPSSSLRECLKIINTSGYHSNYDEVRYFHHFNINDWNQYFLEIPQENIFSNFIEDTDKLYPTRYPNINYWKGFTFMPSLFNVKKTFKEIGPFCTSGFFEGKFCQELYSKTKYNTAFMYSHSVYHCGRLAGQNDSSIKNAYELNDQNQFKNETKREIPVKLIVCYTNQDISDFKKRNMFYEKCGFKYEIYFYDLNENNITDTNTLENYEVSLKEKYLKYIEDNNFKENNIMDLRNENMNDKILRHITSRPNIKFKFKKDIMGYDIKKISNEKFNIPIEEFIDETIKAGGNCFNTYGFIKNVPKDYFNEEDKCNFIDLKLVRGVEEGVYLIYN